MKCVFEDDTICRLCLRVDEKVYRLNNTDHKAFIESIIKLRSNIKYVPPDDLYLCYICNAFLKKSFTFAQTVWNAQEIICDLLKNTDMITKPMLDRHNNKLNPIALSGSVVINVNELLNNDSCNDGHTSTEIGEVDLKFSVIANIQMGDTEVVDLTEDACNYTKPVEEKKRITIKKIETKVRLIDDACDEPKSEKEKRVDIREIGTKVKLTEDACDEPKPEEEKKRVVLKKIGIKNKNPCPTKSKGNLKKSDEMDDDYHPPSTSDSEDSDSDSEYDYAGKLIRRPKDNRVYPMKCDHCEFELLEKRNHYRHYQYMHPDIDYPYKYERDYSCSICGKLFPKNKLKKHEADHVTQEFICPFCPKVFPNSKTWHRHLKNVHPKKTYTCDYCSKEFKTRTDIMRHIRTHTGSKPFKCHICGDAFAHSGNRTLHIRMKHQNYKYAPKKDEKTQKERKNNKHNSTDTEIKNNKQIKRKTATKPRKSKNQSGSSAVRPKRKSTKQT